MRRGGRTLGVGGVRGDEGGHLDGLGVVHDHALHEVDVGVRDGWDGGAGCLAGRGLAGLAGRAGLDDDLSVGGGGEDKEGGVDGGEAGHFSDGFNATTGCPKSIPQGLKPSSVAGL